MSVNADVKPVGTAEWQKCSLLDAEVEYYAKGAGRPLILIDGSAGFRPDGPFLADLADTFSVSAIRLPGFGDMNLPGWISNTDDYAYLCHQVVRKLDLRDAVLMGSSFGGWVAAEMAAMDTSRLSALVLVDPFGLKAGPISKLDVPDIYAMSRASLDALLYSDHERFRFDATDHDDKTLERMARGWETMALLSWDSFFHNPKLKYRIAGIDLPSLILRGENDGLVSSSNIKAFAASIKGAHIAEIANAGHFPMIEKPEETTSRIISFLSAMQVQR